MAEIDLTSQISDTSYLSLCNEVSDEWTAWIENKILDAAEDAVNEGDHFRGCQLLRMYNEWR